MSTPNVCEMMRAIRGHPLPDVTGTVDNAVATGSTVVLEVTWRDTHTGPLAGPSGTVAATGKRQTTRAGWVMNIEQGQITQSRHYFDMLSAPGRWWSRLPAPSGHRQAPWLKPVACRRPSLFTLAGFRSRWDVGSLAAENRSGARGGKNVRSSPGNRGAPPFDQDRTNGLRSATAMPRHTPPPEGAFPISRSSV